jgi:uncharacterized protein YcaQ
MLWGDRVIGWANMKNDDGEDGHLSVQLGFVEQRPRDAVFRRECDAEIERMREFLGARRIMKIALRR